MLVLLDGKKITMYDENNTQVQAAHCVHPCSLPRRDTLDIIEW